LPAVSPDPVTAQDTNTLLFILILINILWINKNGNK